MISSSIERPWWQQQLRKIAAWMRMLRRKYLPYLVWEGDEIDVGVTLKGLGAIGGNPSQVWEAQRALNEMGISFDTGSGLHGRDWEWDWSLKGPISVRFRRRAKNPETRTVRIKPALVVDNNATAEEDRLVTS